ncbi:hypothetical protein [Glycomyces sp. YM15]|uniref:hypothetical protein n=1 Tax=Glycomyces sp. YM15 TaxID=2800446 RepID=UPI0019663B98|nr:hypothetical protein [Glycomyces sp. YM15]
MTSPNLRINGDAVAVNLTDDHPVWMPLRHTHGRVHNTAITGPAYSGKTRMLAYLRLAAHDAGMDVRAIDPLDAAAGPAHDVLEAAAVDLDQRIAGGHRQPSIITVDNTAHLVDDFPSGRRLARLIELGPQLGIGVYYTAETVNGQTKGVHLGMSNVDSVIALREAAFGFGFRTVDLAHWPAAWRSAATRETTGFAPAAAVNQHA